jgi:hypothetical protein
MALLGRRGRLTVQIPQDGTELKVPRNDDFSVTAVEVMTSASPLALALPHREARLRPGFSLC